MLFDMFMKCFVSIFSTLLIFLVVKGVLAFLRRPREAKDQTVVWSKGMLVIGLLGCGLGLLLALWGFLDNGPPGVIALCLGASFLLGGDIILGYFNCRVAYREEDFTVRSFWGVKRTYTYDQITGIQGTAKSRTIRLHVGGKVVKLEDFAVGREQFLSFAKKQYRKGHNGEAIPVLPPKKDLFNGNVENPVDQIAGYVIVTLVLLAALVFFGWFLYRDRNNPEAVRKGLTVLAIFGGLSLIWIGVLVFNVYVLRNPQKFSRRFLKFFGFRECIFKKGVLQKKEGNEKKKRK